jgi:hypothetical protein
VNSVSRRAQTAPIAKVVKLEMVSTMPRNQTLKKSN